LTKEKTNEVKTKALGVKQLNRISEKRKKRGRGEGRILP
jgi:hypothetical protein